MSANGRLSTWKETVQDGDDAFNKRQYREALREYDKAVHMKPRNVNLKIARAETLVYLGRLGAIDSAEFYLLRASQPYREALRVKIAKAKDHLVKGEKARKEDNWIAAIREIDAMITEGADSSQLIMAFRAEMLLRLGNLDQAEGTIRRAFELDSMLLHIRLSKFLGMPLEAYLWAVTAQIEMALGRGETAVEAAEKARRIDHLNDEISAIHTHVRLIHTGNTHYYSGDYLKALEKYTVGLKYALKYTGDYLLINLAACHWHLEMWENCIEICNQVLQIQPDNGNVLAQRADSYAKLEKWAESVKDYEAAIKIYPGNEKIIEGLKESQAALNKSQVTELAETEVEAQAAVKEPQVTELSETPVEAQDAVKEPQVTELSETPVEAQAAVQDSQVTELSETPVEAQVAVKEPQVTELVETEVEAQAAVKEPQVTELSETPVEAQDAVKEPQVTELSETPVEAQAAVQDSQVTELSETPVEAQDAVKEPQVTELSETPVEAQAAVKESQVTELSETPVESQVAVKESQVGDVSED
ncbi:TPR repeat-containing thioredoxin TTL1-like protein [Carex littledalei]|uniref:TPR repeat-containing thioredoxin TTL1-like protein n=1 Tax=Carex littledalei TaxID=544730 RepID=A0A833W0Y1_9POAL|nr:TPR repeat-containing thioredoxin TTL1-like protein [Carex littledalei]